MSGRTDSVPPDCAPAVAGVPRTSAAITAIADVAAEQVRVSMWCVIRGLVWHVSYGPLRVASTRFAEGAELASQPQIRPQQRRPARVVFLVERHMASAIGDLRRAQRRGPRSSPKMGNLRLGCEDHGPAAGAHARTEIHVLEVQEE